MIRCSGDACVDRWLRENLSDEDIKDQARTVESIQPYECSRTVLVPIIGEDSYNEMVRFVYSMNGKLRIKQVDGALDGVRELANMGDVYVVSARNPQQTKNTREWLNLHSFYKHLVDVASTEDPKYADVSKVEDSKKVGIGVHLGARMFVDDDERHMPQNPVDGLDCLLFGPLERNAGKHIIVAKNWSDVVKYAKINYIKS